MNTTPNDALPAAGYWNQRHLLSRNRQQIVDLQRAVGHQTDLSLFQWAQLMALALEFRPDIIIELGRGKGNSTCVFTHAAGLMVPHRCKVVSICLSAHWERETRAAVQAIVSGT